MRKVIVDVIMVGACSSISMTDESHGVAYYALCPDLIDTNGRIDTAQSNLC